MLSETHLIERRYLYPIGGGAKLRSIAVDVVVGIAQHKPAELVRSGAFPVIVDRVTRMLAPVPLATNPSTTLFAIVEFRTMMSTGVPVPEAMMPSLALFALTLSLTVTLMVWVEVITIYPILSIIFHLDVVENAGRSSRAGGGNDDSITTII